MTRLETEIMIKSRSGVLKMSYWGAGDAGLLD
jgi:hypothetical protein